MLFRVYSHYACVRDPSQFLSPPSSVTSSDTHQIPVTIIANHLSSDSPHLSSAINSPHKSQLRPVPSPSGLWFTILNSTWLPMHLTCVYLPYRLSIDSPAYLPGLLCFQRFASIDSRSPERPDSLPLWTKRISGLARITWIYLCSRYSPARHSPLIQHSLQ